MFIDIDLDISNRSACHLILIFFANPKLAELLLLHLVVSEPSGLKGDSYLAKVNLEFGPMSM